MSLFKISLIKVKLISNRMARKSSAAILGNESMGSLPFSLPIVQGKKVKKKCCKKFKKGKRCKKCPGNLKK